MCDFTCQHSAELSPNTFKVKSLPVASHVLRRILEPLPSRTSLFVHRRRRFTARTHRSHHRRSPGVAPMDQPVAAHPAAHAAAQVQLLFPPPPGVLKTARRGAARHLSFSDPRFTRCGRLSAPAPALHIATPPCAASRHFFRRRSVAGRGQADAAVAVGVGDLRRSCVQCVRNLRHAVGRACLSRR